MNYTPHIIALAGPRGVGKTTAAKLLLDLAYDRLSFADPIRDMVHELGVSYEDMFDPVAKETPHPRLLGKSPRYAIMTLGTEWARRYLGEDIWAHAALGRAEDLIRQNKRVVFDDLRFQNEAALIRSHGGVVVELSRPGVPYVGDHPSDQRLPESMIDLTLSSTSAEDLYRQLRSLYIQGLLKQKTP